MAEKSVNKIVLSEEVNDKNKKNINEYKDESKGVQESDNCENIAIGRKISIKSHYSQQNSVSINNSDNSRHSLQSNGN